MFLLFYFGGEDIDRGAEVGQALKIIVERMKNYNPANDENNNVRTECSHDCLNCKFHTRQEGYDQQWGMFKFMYFSCEKGHDVAFHIKSDCCDFEEGENTLIYMTDKEKNNYDQYYIPKDEKQKVSDVLLHKYNDITTEQVLKDFGVDVKDDNKNYRDLCDVLKDISEKWGQHTRC